MRPGRVTEPEPSTHLRPTVTPGSSTQRSATMAPAASVTAAAALASEHMIVVRLPKTTSSPTCRAKERVGQQA